MIRGTPRSLACITWMSFRSRLSGQALVSTADLKMAFQVHRVSVSQETASEIADYVHREVVHNLDYPVRHPLPLLFHGRMHRGYHLVKPGR